MHSEYNKGLQNMTSISEVIKLKERGYSNRQIAKKCNVTPSAIDHALNKAKKDGLWNGTSGTNVPYEDGTAEHPYTIKPTKRKEKREVLKDGSLKPKVSPQYRCSKCKRNLYSLDEVFFVKNKDHIRKQLISQGYTHICLKCLIAYERTQRPQSGELEPCPICGNELAFLRYEGELTNVLWCEECEQAFLPDEKGLDKIRKYAEKTRQPLSKDFTENAE